MADQIIISRAYCDDHLGECWQTYNTATMQTRCIDYATEKKRLELSGYVYTGHRAGQYTWTLRKSAPLALPLDWQMAIEARETKEPEYIQDW